MSLWNRFVAWLEFRPVEQTPVEPQYSESFEWPLDGTVTVSSSTRPFKIWTKDDFPGHDLMMPWDIAPPLKPRRKPSKPKAPKKGTPVPKKGKKPTKARTKRSRATLASLSRPKGKR